VLADEIIVFALLTELNRARYIADVEWGGLHRCVVASSRAVVEQASYALCLVWARLARYRREMELIGTAFSIDSFELLSFRYFFRLFYLARDDAADVGWR
jgi:hypothetical protein